MVQYLAHSHKLQSWDRSSDGAAAELTEVSISQMQANSLCPEQRPTEHCIT